MTFSVDIVSLVGLFELSSEDSKWGHSSSYFCSSTICSNVRCRQKREILSRHRIYVDRMNLDGHRSSKFYEIQEKDVQLNALSKPKCTLYCDWIVRKQMTQSLIDTEDLS